jgi:hypothetical protein
MQRLQRGRSRIKLAKSALIATAINSPIQAGNLSTTSGAVAPQGSVVMGETDEISTTQDPRAKREGVNHLAVEPQGARDDFTVEALRALAELDAHGHGHRGIMLRFGEAVSKAKAQLNHGDFTPWCENTLKRKPSWCAAHKRLYECGGDLDAARAWAKETGHRWADCNSVERLLGIVGDWRKAKRGVSPSAPKARQKPSEIIAELRRRLAEDDADFLALRDALPPEIEARVAELLAAIAAGDVAAKEEIAEIARKYHWRFRDLVQRETCVATQVSDPSPEVSADAQPDAPKFARLTSDEASAERQERDSPLASAAPAATLDNVVNATRLEYEPSPGDEGPHGAKPEKAAPPMTGHPPTRWVIVETRKSRGKKRRQVDRWWEREPDRPSPSARDVGEMPR